MAGIGTSVVSFFGIVSMLCLLISGLVLINLIQKAFERDGVLWGLISIFYPIGTYFYCRKNWDAYRSPFILVTVLIVTYSVLWLVVKFS